MWRAVAREKGDDYQMQNKEKLCCGDSSTHSASFPPFSNLSYLSYNLISLPSTDCIAPANNLINKLSDAHKTTQSLLCSLASQDTSKMWGAGLRTDEASSKDFDTLPIDCFIFCLNLVWVGLRLG